MAGIFSRRIQFLKLFDFMLFFSVAALVTIGILFIYSAGFNSDGINVSGEYIKQIIWAFIGLFMMFFVMLIDYRGLEKHAGKLFIALIVVLVITRLFGKKINGARSWLSIGPLGIQPSEFCKILYILYLARFFHRSEGMPPLRRFIYSLLIFMVPFALIMAQPDLGTSSVFLPILLMMMLFGGIPLRLIFMLLLGGCLTVYLTVLPTWQQEIAQRAIPAVSLLTNIKLRGIIVLASGAICVIGIIGMILYKENRYFYWIAYAFGIICAALVMSYGAGKFLKSYQIERLIIFINPEVDERGAGWHIIQSMTAVGSGGLFGEGFLQGNLSHLRYLPEQSTDFIFGILSEETGFVGGLVVFFLYFAIMARTLSVIRNATNAYGMYIASGVFGMFLWHFTVNVGMVIGSMPITGIPLFFLSYGGSSLLTAMTAVGLLMSVRYRKHDFD